MDMKFDIKEEPNPLDLLEIQVEQDDDNSLEIPVFKEEHEEHARMEALRLALTSPMRNADFWRYMMPTKNDEIKIAMNGQETFLNSATRKTVPIRYLGPRCKCNRNCRSLMQGRETEIFQSFWDIGDFNTQNAYLYSCIRALKPKRAYLHKRTNADTSRRGNTFQYYVNVNGSDVRICKQEFASIHGLQNSYGRIKNIQRMMTTGKGGPKREGRGKPSLIQKYT